jgi:hypothetical protein
MNTDNAPAHSDVLWMSGSGDAGRGGVERRSLLLVTFTHQTVRNRLSGYSNKTTGLFSESTLFSNSPYRLTREVLLLEWILTGLQHLIKS